MTHILHCLLAAARHPRIAALGAHEFRDGVGMSYDDPAHSEAYDAGRELAHIVTRRRFDDCAE